MFPEDLSKKFKIIYKLLLRSIIPENFYGCRLDDMHYLRRYKIFWGYIRKNEFCFLVWSQGAGCNFTRLLGYFCI